MAFHMQPYRQHRQVRPFVLAGGRTRTRTRHQLLVHTIVSAPAYNPGMAAALTPQERAVYQCAAAGMSVAEVSAHTGLSLGLVRVICGDLANREALSIHSGAEDPAALQSLLEEVLHGLQQL